jgi:hypothetical protein
MSLNSGELLLLDTNQKSLVEISLSQKTNQVLAGSQQLGNVTEASVNGDFAFAYSQDKGVVKVDSQSLKTTVAAKPDSDWGEIKDVVGFGGNFYLLDNIKNQIWKYTPTDSGYSDKIPYLKSDTKVDFSTAKRMLIDSSVWVLHSDNNIDRFTEGSPDSFSVGGLDKPIENISAFFVSSDTDNLYLLDSTNSRLVVLTKSGQYVSQLTGDKFKDAQDLVVDEPAKKVYLLENNKIYQISLP